MLLGNDMIDPLRGKGYGFGDQTIFHTDRRRARAPGDADSLKCTSDSYTISIPNSTGGIGFCKAHEMFQELILVPLALILGRKAAGLILFE